MNKLNRIISLGLALVISAASSGCYFLPDEEEVLAPPTVKASDVKYTTVTAKRKDLEKKIVNSGTITSEKQYNLSYSDNSGTVVSFYVHAGDVVKKGDKICELDTTDIDYQVSEQELYLKKAQLDVTCIKEADGSQAEIDKANVEVELIQNKLDKLYAQRDGATLTADADGTITNVSSVRVGDSVNPGQTIATILDTTALYVAIEPDDASEYKMDMELELRLGDVTYTGVVFMTPHDLQDYNESQKDNHEEVDETAITYEDDKVYIRFKDGEAPTDAVGQLVDAVLILDSVQDAIVISNNLIKSVDEQSVVYVLKNDEKVAVDVEIGLQTGSQSEIKSGLEEGDLVIVR